MPGRRAARVGLPSDFGRRFLRLFVAFLLDERVRDRLRTVQDRLRRSCDAVRWVKPEQMHVTIQFLGEVADADIADVTEAVARGAAKGASFTLTIGECGCFPPRGTVRVVWVGAEDETGVMRRSVGEIQNELSGVGFEPERRAWSSHITIGRARNARADSTMRNSIERYTYDSLDQRAESAALMASVLTPTGPTYTEVSRAALG